MHTLPDNQASQLCRAAELCRPHQPRCPAHLTPGVEQEQAGQPSSCTEREPPRWTVISPSSSPTSVVSVCRSWEDLPRQAGSVRQAQLHAAARSAHREQGGMQRRSTTLPHRCGAHEAALRKCVDGDAELPGLLVVCHAGCHLSRKGPSITAGGTSGAASIACMLCPAREGCHTPCQAEDCFRAAHRPPVCTWATGWLQSSLVHSGSLTACAWPLATPRLAITLPPSPSCRVGPTVVLL